MSEIENKEKKKSTRKTIQIILNTEKTKEDEDKLETYNHVVGSRTAGSLRSYT